MSSVDYYATPFWVIRQFMPHILEHLGNFDAPIVLEPSAGDGRIIQSIFMEVSPCVPDAAWMAVEMHNQRPYPEPIISFLSTDYLRWDPPMECDLIITNPPFSQAEAFIRRSIPFLSDDGALMLLLRLGFLSSSGRANGLWRDYPPAMVHVLPNRPAFEKTRGGGDKADYGWYVWKKNWNRPTLLNWLPVYPLDERRKDEYL